MKKPFTLKEVKPGIFLLEFRDEYDMCMYFLRYQEFYESSSPRYRGKSFEILDFMKWYSKKYGKGAFTYAVDWAGFNFPGDTIEKVWKLGINDRNLYDYEMREVSRECQRRTGGKFYIIGVTKGNGALHHEIAHGMFYLNPQYKKEMTALVKALPPNLRKAFNTYLKEVGYTPKVYVDEIQANMATAENLRNTKLEYKAAEELIKLQPEFQAVFKKYFKGKK